jgi:hypothetical protein
MSVVKTTHGEVRGTSADGIHTFLAILSADLLEDPRSWERTLWDGVR